LKNKNKNKNKNAYYGCHVELSEQNDFWSDLMAEHVW
jgi:hypothetical protein